MTAVEKLNSPYEKNTSDFQSLGYYSKLIDSENLYDGFVDIVITFPTTIRVAGIEFLNPWYEKDSIKWKRLPSKFKIYKVDNSLLNEGLEEYTYADDIAQKTSATGSKTLRPIRYDKTETDNGLIFLGSYDIDWKNLESYKCFFKFNPDDQASIASESNFSNGTATWKCKELVIRITSTTESTERAPIEDRIAAYIRSMEIQYGTTINERTPSLDECKKLIGAEEISSETTDEKYFGWKFGSTVKRSYSSANDVKFECGINYVLGGIQLLLSPDIFSISEMKMYNYYNGTNNKVYIGEWNADLQNVEFYGTNTTRISPDIVISTENLSTVKWKHNFNISPKYLEAKVFLKFIMDFDTFKSGDVVTNLVTAEKVPLSFKLTNNEIQLNISKRFRVR